MLGVIVCPRCALVQGADLSTARTTCPRCGKRIEVRKAKVYFSTDSPKELAEGVRRVGEKLMYDLERPGAARESMPEGSSQKAERPLRPMVLHCLESGDEISLDEIREGLGDVDEEELDRTISQLLASGLIYEVSAGRYRAA